MEETARDAYFEDEIDLRKYALVLIRNWWLIAAATLVAGAIAMVVSFNLPPTYEATALVAFTESRYQLQFDPRFEAVPFEPPGAQTAQVLATSDDVLQLVLRDIGDELPPEVSNLDSFKTIIEAEIPSNAQILRLKASATRPELAAHIANAWAEHFVGVVNEVLSGASREQQFFEGQVEEAEAELKAAEQAVIAFEATNDVEILRSELNSRQSLLATYLDQRNEFTMLLQNTEGLMTRIESLPAGSSPGLGNELSVLGLQIQAVNAEPGVPIQIQLTDDASLSSKTVGEQSQYLTSVQSSVTSRLGNLRALGEPLREEILILQGKIEAAEAEQRRLILERDLASQNLVSLSNVLAEARIEADNPQEEVRLASQAGVPTQPTSPNILLNTVVAAALGFMLGVFLVFLWAWWSPAPDAKPESEHASKLYPELAPDP